MAPVMKRGLLFLALVVATILAACESNQHLTPMRSKYARLELPEEAIYLGPLRQGQILLKAQIVGILRTQEAGARSSNVLRKFATSMHRKPHLYG
jgi:hypothetical protein